jgi:hypothetical protein
MIKSSQIFGYEQEPADERPSAFMGGGFSEFGALSGYSAFDAVSNKPLPPRRSPLMAPEANRAPPSEGDKAPSRLVPRWLDTLPEGTRPVFLCEHFPRIANRLALCWADAPLTIRLLDEFFQDKRGTRRGFPPQATAELKALRRLAAQPPAPGPARTSH